MSEINYKELTIKPSSSWWMKQKATFLMQRFLYKFPAAAKPFRFLGHRLWTIGTLPEQEKKRLKFIELLNKERQGVQEFGSGYGYDDAAKEFIVTAKYHDQLRRQDFEQMASESGVLYQNAVTSVSKLLDRDSSIAEVINFGVCYAHIDSVLAQKHPNTKFIAIDRSDFTKIYNQEFFSNVKNLEFVAGDIFDLLNERPLTAPVLFHARTATYVPKTFMEKLYKTAYDRGCKYIVGLEQAGISRQNYKPYEFSEEDQPSVLFRDGFFMHNYPALLLKAGFKVEQIELLKTKHPHEDYRILSFVAKRVEKK
jgi:hypothetical protein